MDTTEVQEKAGAAGVYCRHATEFTTKTAASFGNIF